MQDETNSILKTFSAYAQAFESLDPELVEPFFHHPAILMTSEQVAPMKNAEEVKGVFTALFHNLKLNNFARSQLESTQIKQLSKNQAIVSGVATRYRKDGSVLEHFGLTYTMRKVDESWQIIFGVLHEPIAGILNDSAT